MVADGDLTALVPSARTFLGPAPLGTALPFIMLSSISKVDLNIPAPGVTRSVSERVQVTVVARNYPEQKAILRAARRAAADKLNPAVPDISGVTIHTDGAGPDFYDEDYAGWRGSQDLRVRYLEIR
jgi:hypothetical protein